MKRAEQAIGAVQTMRMHQCRVCGTVICDSLSVMIHCERLCISWDVPIASAHKATGGKIHEPAANAGNAPTHFPAEPSGGCGEKLVAENIRD
jgi:hypothetical protein